MKRGRTADSVRFRSRRYSPVRERVQAVRLCGRLTLLCEIHSHSSCARAPWFRIRRSGDVMNQIDAHTSPTRIAIVQSCWHKDIVDRGRESFLTEASKQGIRREAVDVIEVPGAFEIPLHAKVLAD